VIRDGKFLLTTNPDGPSVSTLALNANAAPTVLSATPTDPGTVDPAISHDGRFLYVETGAKGIVDEFRVGHDGSLTPIGARWPMQPAPRAWRPTDLSAATRPAVAATVGRVLPPPHAPAPSKRPAGRLKVLTKWR
jgi:hypothetical protein